MLMLLLVVLVAITAVIWVIRDQKNVAENDKNIFNGFDVKSINQVNLQSPKGSVDLKYDGARWTVNDQYAADPAMIEVMFATMLQAIPKRPVPTLRQDSIAGVLRKEGIQVTMQADGEPRISFSAGGNMAKTQSYFLRGDDKVPYIMVIPGYRVYVSGIFELNESGWRDKRIFAFNWRLNFKDVETTYSRNKADNFRVELKDQLLTVQGLSTVDSARLNQYLNDVSQLAADEFVDTNKTLDSLSKTPPVMEVSVHDVGRTYLLQLFPYADNQGRVAGLIGEKQWAMFNRRAVTSISRPRRFFEPKP
ncbi:DUF4340 domain-containing protein [Chryseolinea sp. T2]|uniref:DUF4340 domain-containing protein n=1 Tax=Chryseolinea sp. T2 TaxID=3129255 RepID=UPI0030774735